MEQRDQAWNVVALEGVDVASEKLSLVVGDGSRDARAEVAGGERGASALQGAIDRGDARFE